MSESSALEPIDSALFAESPTPCILFGRDGDVHAINPAASAAFGWRRDALRGADALRRIFGADSGRFRETLDAAFASGRAEMQALAVQTEEFGAQSCALRLVALGQPADRAIALLIAGEPAAEQRTALAAAMVQAAEARRSRDLFVSAMSHELRSPLNAILGFAELLELHVAHDPAERATPGADVISPEESVVMIRDSARHLLSLINDILDFAKIEAGRGELNDSAVDLGAVIDGAARIIRPQAIAAGRRFDVWRGDAPLRVLADEKALRQVILNLASNAVKFTGEAGRILIEIVAVEDGAAIAVRDDGVGLDAHLHDSVFDPFAQADRQFDRAFEGAGLGLPISRALMRRHGGDLTLAPGLDGRGLSALARLPANRILEQ